MVVAESHERVLAAQGRPEQLEVLGSERIECAHRASIEMQPPADLMQVFASSRDVVDGCDGFELAGVGEGRDLAVAMEAGVTVDHAVAATGLDLGEDTDQTRRDAILSRHRACPFLHAHTPV